MRQPPEPLPWVKNHRRLSRLPIRVPKSATSPWPRAGLRWANAEAGRALALFNWLCRPAGPCERLRLMWRAHDPSNTPYCSLNFGFISLSPTFYNKGLFSHVSTCTNLLHQLVAASTSVTVSAWSCTMTTHSSSRGAVPPPPRCTVPQMVAMGAVS